MPYKITPNDEKLQYLFVCSLCSEETWYGAMLPEKLLKGHNYRNVGRRCRGTLVFKESRPLYPKTDSG